MALMIFTLIMSDCLIFYAFLKLVIHNRRSFYTIFPPQMLNEYLPALRLRVGTSEIHKSDEKKITSLTMIIICRGKKIKQHRNTYMQGKIRMFDFLAILICFTICSDFGGIFINALTEITK